MSTTIMYGDELASDTQKKLKNKVNDLKNRGINTSLSVIIVGNNPTSKTYVQIKKEDCEKIGIHSTIKAFDSDISEGKLLNYIKQLNNDESVNGILVQLPLPEHIDENDRKSVV